ncbi:MULTISPECIES: type VI secretion system protein IglI family protein [Francisella]|uniref:Uncharacterized protein n=1 Tax=Francisella opportunistica TaxID=2016517 RepID=A0A345JTK0_9GAMM|nr:MULTISPECIES: type VI secretion system protein IglI family protein [Francisella]APC92445.1 hypothetical protein BBG19_1721 [Francisella sp. MA067296]AXH30646.1 hypothetical protein CGC43_08720 [Francisella opportunistica]AXH32286.1 hypothetical protein CGC44_08690 [Francisella opportunistica]AXH33935.1 hypothetical protein CGC45_08750 [Francisella opportunistica]
MILDVINQVSEEKDICYRAEVNEFEPIYEALEREEYLNAKELSLELINKGCLDPRYVIYAEFGYWHESTSFDINAKILGELINIHEFFLEKIEAGKIRSKVYTTVVEWFHASIFAHAKFIKRNAEIYFEGDKLVLTNAFDEYVSFIKANLPSINVIQIDQIKNTYKTFPVVQEVVEVDEIQDEQFIETDDIKKDCLESSLSSNNSYISDEWSKLLRNIKIYRKLVAEKSWIKAAVVYQIINSALREFDPIKYFPETFYPYLKDTANAYDHLMHQLSLSKHPLWLMLSQMFKSDPESFYREDSLGGIREILIREINSNTHENYQEYETAMNDEEQNQLNW